MLTKDLVGVLSTFLRLVIQSFQFCSFMNVSIISLVPFGMLQFPVLKLSLFYLLFLFVHACVKEITVAKKLSALNRISPNSLSLIESICKTSPQLSLYSVE